MSTNASTLSLLQDTHRRWVHEHQRWAGEARTWLHEILEEEDCLFGYFSPSLRNMKEQLLAHLQAIQEHDDLLDERDFALYFYRAFDIEPSQRLAGLHADAARSHALQRQRHQSLKRQVDGALD